MKSTLAYEDYSDDDEAEAAGKEYQWREDGKDGMRSYSYTKSNSTWSYAKQTGTGSDGRYTFSDSSTGQPFARRGNLYNWTAATLGSGLNLKAQGDQAQDSICPHGWQLPIKSDNKSFAKLLTSYDIISGTAGWNRMMSKPLQYLPTGFYYNYGYIDSHTYNGLWWSGVAYNNNSDISYYLLVNPGGIREDNDYRGNGYALRCGTCAFSFFARSKNQNNRGKCHNLYVRFFKKRTLRSISFIAAF